MSPSFRMRGASAWPAATDSGLRLSPVYIEDSQGMWRLWWRPGEPARVR